VKRPGIRCSAILLAGLCLAGCAFRPPPIYRPGIDRERVTRACLRPDDGRLWSSNLFVLSGNIPPGTPARIRAYTDSEILLRVGGASYVMFPVPREPGIYFPVDDRGIDNFVQKLFAEPEEDLGLDRLDPATREAVVSGRTQIGMSKEQVYTCLGPPMEIDEGIVTLPLPLSEILGSDVWTYPYQDGSLDVTRARVYFEDGKLVRQDL
jgi:hypothetical protein